MATATALSATQHSVQTRILDQAGAKLLLAITLLAHPVMGRAGTAITTVRAAGVLTAEVILGAASETFATDALQWPSIFGVGLVSSPIFSDAIFRKRI